MAEHEWCGAETIPERSYTCGFCGVFVGSNRGYRAVKVGSEQDQWHIHICPKCEKTTFFVYGKQVPAPVYGKDVDSLPGAVERLYREARDCVAAGLYTSAVLACRKILMHLAAEKGAEAGNTFLGCIEHLAEEGYIHRDAQGWVDRIRSEGDEADCEILIMGQGEAEALISFCEFMLRAIYEFPGKVPDGPPAEEKRHIRDEKRDLQMAKSYLSSGLTDRARGLLLEIIDRYPDSDSAAEAVRILEGR